MKRTSEIAFALLLAFAAARCAQRSEAETTAPKRHIAAPGVTIDDNALPQLRIEPVRVARTPDVLLATGKVTFDEDHYARLLSPVAGRIASLRVRPGDRVSRGETLAVVHSRDAAAAANDHAEAMKDLDVAAKTYVMTRDLFAHEAASRISLDQAEADLTKAKARVARTSKSLDVLGISDGSDAVPLRAPIDGVVITRSVSEGQIVQGDGTPLIEIADLSRVWVIADVFERDLRLVKAGATADLTTNAYPDEHFAARVERIGDVLDPATRTAKVRFSVENPSRRLKPEMFAAIRLTTSDEAAITIPVQAQVVEDGKSFVFVRSGERTFDRRPVQLADGGEGKLRVIAGLSGGEQIVTDGALLLRSEQRSKE